MPATVYIGRYRTSPDNTMVTLPENTIGFSVANDVPQNCWMHTGYVRAGQPAGTPTGFIRIGVYETDDGSDPDPDVLRAQFDQHGVGITMSDPEGGAFIDFQIRSGDARAWSGENLAIAVHAQDEDLVVGAYSGSTVYEQEDQFTRAGWTDDDNLPDPAGWTTRVTTSVDQYTAWIVAADNEPPLTPTSLSPSGTIESVTPTMTAAFRDVNGDYGGSAAAAYGNADYIGQAQIQVRRKSDAVSFWDNTYSTTIGEQSANQSSKVYAGTALVRGTVYQHRVRHADRFNEWGPWSAWIDFMPRSLGSVTLAGDPTGKTDDLTPDYQFTWGHETPLSTDRAQAQVLRNGVVVQTSGEITITVANGATGTLTAAAHGLPALTPGLAYTYRVRARDTGGVWTDYSTERSFTVDAAPTVPTELSPANSTVLSSSSYPVLSARSTDADDTSATGHVVKFEILTGAGALISTRTATKRAGDNDWWDYQTVAGDLAAVGSYRHRAYAGDGFLWSGGVEVEASATRSAEALFSWQAVPNTAITAPTDGAVVDSTTPAITWTVTTQDKYRVRLLEAGAEIYSTGWVTDSGTRSINLPLGYTHNGGAYSVEVSVDDDTLVGTDTNAFTVVYTPPPSLGSFAVDAMTVGDDPYPTAALGTWDAYEGSAFEAYIIYRDDLSVPFQIITDPNTTQFVDYHAPIDGPAYSGVVIEQRGQELVESELATAVLSQLPIRGVALVSIARPQSERFISPHWKDVSFSMDRDESTFLPWGASAPVPLRGAADWWEGSLGFHLTEETFASVIEAKLLLETLARGSGFSYRDRDGFRAFLRIPRGGLQMTRERLSRYRAAAKVIETPYQEGVQP